MIEASHLCRDFGSFRAVDDVSFSIKTGEIVGLLGPNGAGKTTTIRMITGFLAPTSGTVIVDGENIEGNATSVKRKIGYMPESAPLYGDMIVEDYLTYVAQMYGKDPAEKLSLYARLCGIGEVMDKNISDLSRGYRQRVGLAHALMNDPEILILDEPTGGLDPNQIGEVRSLIKEIGKTRTVIISTHILSEVEMLCDRVIIISNGKITADSPTEDLQTRFQQDKVIKLTAGGCSSFQELSGILAGIPGLISLKQDEEEPGNGLVSILLSVERGKEIRPEIFSRLASANRPIYEMTLRRNTLEDIFRTLTIGSENDA